MIVPLMNKYVADLDSTVGKDGIFSTDYVKQVKTASKLILSDISSATGVKACEGSLRSMNLNKSSITINESSVMFLAGNHGLLVGIVQLTPFGLCNH